MLTGIRKNKDAKMYQALLPQVLEDLHTMSSVFSPMKMS